MVYILNINLYDFYRLDIIMDNHIAILPKISNTRSGKKDPDIDTILKSEQNDLDIMNLKHQPTKEEQLGVSPSCDSPKTWTWLVVTLAVVVVILIIVIVWFVLGANETTDAVNAIPRHILKNNIPPPHPQQIYQRFNQQPNQQPNQTENIAIDIKSMNTKPTKQELLSTLNKMNTIPEENAKQKIKPSRKQEVISKQKHQDGEPGDETLVSNFYTDLQGIVDEDEDEDEDDCVIDVSTPAVLASSSETE